MTKIFFPSCGIILFAICACMNNLFLFFLKVIIQNFLDIICIFDRYAYSSFWDLQVYFMHSVIYPNFLCAYNMMCVVLYSEKNRTKSTYISRLYF